MSGRVLRHTFRSIDTLITVVAMPIMMMLMFVYIFGGAINTGSVNYINFVLPGIILITITSGMAYTAVRLNNDVTNGIFERFHSMPIDLNKINDRNTIDMMDDQQLKKLLLETRNMDTKLKQQKACFFR